jgi:HAD superfamily hydrolase (TIGR01490 family)
MTTPSAIACFDLDGTLIKGDSFALFVRYVIGRRLISLRCALKAVLALVLRKLRVISLVSAKEMCLSGLKGARKSELSEIADSFVRERLRNSFRSEVVSRLKQHQALKDRVIILTSTPDLYLSAVARLLEVSEACGSEVVFDDGRFTGAIGTHLFGAAKLEKLREMIPCPDTEVTVYSDHHSDLELIQFATNPVVVYPTPSLRHLATTRGWPILDSTNA